MKNVYLEFTASPFGNRYKIAENFDENDDFMYDTLIEHYNILIFNIFKYYSVFLHQQSGKDSFTFTKKEITFEESKFKVIIRSIADDLINFFLGDSNFSYSQEYHLKLFGIDLFICLNYSEHCDNSNDIKDII